MSDISGEKLPPNTITHEDCTVVGRSVAPIPQKSYSGLATVDGKVANHDGRVLFVKHFCSDPKCTIPDESYWI